MTGCRRLTWGAVLLAACLSGCGEPPPGLGGKPREPQEIPDPLEDSLVNPSFIFEPFPEDNPEAADENTTLLRYVIDEPTSLNPIFPNSWADGYIREVLFDTLTLRDKDTTLYWNPDRVVDVEESEDRLTTTIHLRPGLTWHDGHPWSAHDVQFTWEVLRGAPFPQLEIDP